jgi:16S rRNA (uracil1498-N3)-methyltransferase
MPHNRYYCDAAFAENAPVSITGDECHHLIRVLRARPNDSVELVNGRSQLAHARVVHILKHSAEFLIDRVVQETKPKAPLILAMAMPRMNHLEWIIEKGTELNATAFWLFPGLLSEKETLSDLQCARLKHLAISAMKQCGRLDLPAIELKPPLLKWAFLPGTLFFGDTAEDAPFLWNLPLIKPLLTPVILFIGPEKGFDPQESAFLHNTMKANSIRLHPNILRTETAPLVGLSLIQTLML